MDDLRAVLLCDWFGDAFAPLPQGKTPQVLLPCGTVPLIDYWLIFFRQHKVREALLAVAHGADELEQYIHRWKKENHKGRMQIKVVDCVGAASAGDALRDIETKRLISEDFLLCQADMLVDGDISAIIEQHIKKRQNSRHCVMTKVFRKAPATEKDISPLDRIKMVQDKSTGEILKYAPGLEKLTLPASCTKDLFKAGQDFQLDVQYDLLDCRLDICGPEVLGIMNEHFDMNDVRKNFVSTITDAKFEDEISSQQVNGVVVDNLKFANFVKDPRSLYTAGTAILKNLTAKAKPDAKVTPLFEEVFVDAEAVKPAPGGNVHGRAVQIGDKATCRASAFGSNVQVGANAAVTKSIVCDGAIVGEEAEIEEAFIGPNAVVKKGAVVGTGAVIGANVVVDENATVLPFARLIYDDEAKDEMVGEKGKGAVVPCERPEVIVQMEAIGADTMLWTEVIEHVKAEAEALEAENNVVEEDDGLDQFQREYKDMILSSIEMDSCAKFGPTEPLVLELKSMRMGAHKSCSESIQAMVPVICNFIKEAVQKGDKVMPVIAKWGSLIQYFWVKGSDEEPQTAIKAIEEECRKEATLLGPGKFSMILQVLMKEEVLPQAAIIEWHEGAIKLQDDMKAYTGGEMEQFVNWLKEPSDDEDSSDEE